MTTNRQPEHNSENSINNNSRKQGRQYRLIDILTIVTPEFLYKLDVKSINMLKMVNKKFNTLFSQSMFTERKIKNYISHGMESKETNHRFTSEELMEILLFLNINETLKNKCQEHQIIRESVAMLLESICNKIYQNKIIFLDEGETDEKAYIETILTMVPELAKYFSITLQYNDQAMLDIARNNNVTALNIFLKMNPKDKTNKLLLEPQFCKFLSDAEFKATVREQLRTQKMKFNTYLGETVLSLIDRIKTSITFAPSGVKKKDAHLKKCFAALELTINNKFIKEEHEILFSQLINYLYPIYEARHLDEPLSILENACNDKSLLSLRIPALIDNLKEIHKAYKSMRVNDNYIEEIKKWDGSERPPGIAFEVISEDHNIPKEEKVARLLR